MVRADGVGTGAGWKDAVVAFAFLVAIPSAASEPAFSRSSLVRHKQYVFSINRALLSVLVYAFFWGSTSKKREKAGSLGCASE
jgi:hypothetical protein